ncbi:unnamed protein product [marine sediment metagenome]|uniref:Uncharacterized protein n=1 Tax=marine sediment metagenome TaxID=412755 RepID=X0T8B1_9ZZZZ
MTNVKHVQEKNKRIGQEGGMTTGGGGLNELRRGRRVWVRLRLKGCPRCRGDLVVELDQWGWYEACIQCGYLHDLQSVVEVKQQAAE